MNRFSLLFNNLLRFSPQRSILISHCFTSRIPNPPISNYATASKKSPSPPLVGTISKSKLPNLSKNQHPPTATSIKIQPKSTPSRYQLPKLTPEIEMDLERMFDCFVQDRPFDSKGKTDTILFTPCFVYNLHHKNPKASISILDRFFQVADIWFSRALPLFSIYHQDYGYCGTPVALKYLGMINSMDGRHGVIRAIGLDAVEYMTKIMMETVGMQYFEEEEIIDAVIGMANLATCEARDVIFGQMVELLAAFDSNLSKKKAAPNQKQPQQQLFWSHLFRGLESTEWEKQGGMMTGLLVSILKMTRCPYQSFLTYLQDWSSSMNAKLGSKSTNLISPNSTAFIMDAFEILEAVAQSGIDHSKNRYLINDLIRMASKLMESCWDEAKLKTDQASGILATFGSTCCDFQSLPLRIDEKTWTVWFGRVKQYLSIDRSADQSKQNDQVLLVAVIRVVDQYRRMGDYRKISGLWKQRVLEFGGNFQHRYGRSILKHLHVLEKRDSMKMDQEVYAVLKCFEKSVEEEGAYGRKGGE